MFLRKLRHELSTLTQCLIEALNLSKWWLDRGQDPQLQTEKKTSVDIEKTEKNASHEGAMILRETKANAKSRTFRKTNQIAVEVDPLSSTARSKVELKVIP